MFRSTADYIEFTLFCVLNVFEMKPADRSGQVAAPEVCAELFAVRLEEEVTGE